MNAGQHPSADEARVSLEAAASARRAVAAATRRPMWLDAALAVASGVGLAIAGIGGWPAIAAGLTLVVVAGTLFTVIERRSGRHRGRVMDERALGAHAARFFPMYGVIAAANLLRPDGWQPWYSIAVAVVVTVAAFVYLRLDGRYQARRLAAGDYGRYDLL